VLGAARALLALPDFPGTNKEREERLRLVLDELALAYGLSEDLSTDQEVPDPTTGDYQALRARFAAAFPDLGLYSAVFDPLTPEPQPDVTAGDALDDLTDIALDQHEVLARAAVNVDDALWHFRFGYQTHWGRHMRWLQLVLHERASSVVEVPGAVLGQAEAPPSRRGVR
jgi:hypothetical protein